jgi:hypothetical protein
MIDNSYPVYTAHIGMVGALHSIVISYDYMRNTSYAGNTYTFNLAVCSIDE